MRIKLLLLALLLSLAVPAQNIRIRGISRVSPDDRGKYMVTGQLPGTPYLLITGEDYNGLSLLDSRKGGITVISTEPGAGYGPAVTADGRELIYRTNDFSGNRRLTSVYRYNMESGRNEVLISKERNVLTPAVSGNTVLIKTGREAVIKSFDSLALKSKVTETYLVIEDMTLVLYRGDTRKILKPNGDGYYIWASLSPDGSGIVYNFQGRGTYICDTDGNVLHDLGKVNAPRWLNNEIVIGMDDRDDGQRIISSELVYYSLSQGTGKVLTKTAGRAEIYPVPFDSGRKIAFSTEDGKIYIMKIRVR